MYVKWLQVSILYQYHHIYNGKCWEENGGKKIDILDLQFSRNLYNYSTLELFISAKSSSENAKMTAFLVETVREE